MENPLNIKYLLNACLDASRHGMRSSGGVYMIRPPDEQGICAVFKPADEEVGSVNNPRGHNTMAASIGREGFQVWRLGRLGGAESLGVTSEVRSRETQWG